MSWKPCRGGRVLFDKALKNSHECFFEFKEATTIKEKSKIAFKWYRADEYLNKADGVIQFIGEKFISQCLQSKDTYKPFLTLLQSLSK